MASNGFVLTSLYNWMGAICVTVTIRILVIALQVMAKEARADMMHLPVLRIPSPLQIDIISITMGHHVIALDWLVMFIPPISSNSRRRSMEVVKPAMVFDVS